ncbi:hypothetical protein [Halomonas sp. AOP43-F2-13]|uniref:hypothetical protein n=1 Tax=Halomonas sp. AOP43-F2-13 TaxID=3457657 RepID=UPI004033595C
MHSIEAGYYFKKLGDSNTLAASLRGYRHLDGGRPHRFTRLVLDRWALEEPNRCRLLLADPVRLGWLLEAAQDQGNRELELLTSLEAQRQRENGMMDTDILMEANLNLRMPNSLPYRNIDL